MASQQIEDYLRLSTVKLAVPNAGHGTGFFVTPNLILTCAHVVKSAGFQPIPATWQDKKKSLFATLEKFSESADVALLNCKTPNNLDIPSVELGEELQVGDNLCLFGYPDEDFPQGCPALLTYEGLTGDGLIKLQRGQIRPGMSGSPLLNLRTGKVCGIVKFTRDRGTDLGGGAVPMSTVFSQFPDLHKNQLRSIKARKRKWTAIIASASIFFSGMTVISVQWIRSRPSQPEPVLKVEDWLTYENIEYGVKIKYPPNWSPLEIFDPITAELFSFIAPESDLYEASPPRLTISREVISNNDNQLISLEEYVEQYVISSVKQFLPKSKVIDQQRTAMAKKPAYQVVYEGEIEGELVQIMEMIVFVDEHVYIASYEASHKDYLIFEELATTMLRSFELIQ